MVNVAHKRHEPLTHAVGGSVANRPRENAVHISKSFGRGNDLTTRLGNWPQSSLGTATPAFGAINGHRLRRRPSGRG